MSSVATPIRCVTKKPAFAGNAVLSKARCVDS